jgi:N-acetylmuramoyl-L-alanine amidase
MLDVPKTHTVAPSDDMAAIADRHGFFWQTLWDVPENAALKEKRANPNVLQQGDTVHIPDLRRKQESCADQQRHTFVRKGVPSKIRIVLRRDGEPRAGLPYVFTIAGDKQEGTTGDDGSIELAIPPGATSGVLTLTDGGVEERRTLDVGRLDPVQTPLGVQQRLANLRYDARPTGTLDAQTLAACNALRADHDMDPSDTVDDALRAKLVELHGC